MAGNDGQQPTLVAEQEFQPGQPATVMGPSPSTPYSAVFEDDGDTAYFCGLDTRQAEQPILDALHIYNGRDITDKTKPSIAQVVWSAAGLRVALFINDYPHAAFDFVKRGYCRTGFPPPAATFSAEGHDWSDEILRFFE